MKAHKKVMSYFGKVIWTDGECFMVAKGDRTDEYFATIYEAMAWICSQKGIKQN